MRKTRNMKMIVDDFIKGNPAGKNLTREDISAFVWDELQNNLRHRLRPNVWEVGVSSADIAEWGSIKNIAIHCAYAIRDAWQSERPKDNPLEFCVLCNVGLSVRKGFLYISASQVSHQTYLHRMAIAPYENCVVITNETLRQMEVIAKQEAEKYSKEQKAEQDGHEISDKPILSSDFCVICSLDGSVFDVKDDLRVGRYAVNQIVIDDPHVSGTHGEFIRDKSAPSGWAFVDMQSTNGSTRNGDAFFDKALLADGDRIGIANVCYLEFLKRCEA